MSRALSLRSWMVVARRSVSLRRWRVISRSLGVVAGGELFEAEFDRWGSFGVGCDGADLAAVESVADVEVAEFGTAQGAAVSGFLSHLVFDVGAGLAGLVLVEGGQDAVHELPDG